MEVNDDSESLSERIRRFEEAEAAAAEHHKKVAGEYEKSKKSYKKASKDADDRYAENEKYRRGEDIAREYLKKLFGISYTERMRAFGARAGAIEDETEDYRDAYRRTESERSNMKRQVDKMEKLVNQYTKSRDEYYESERKRVQEQIKHYVSAYRAGELFGSQLRNEREKIDQWIYGSLGEKGAKVFGGAGFIEAMEMFSKYPTEYVNMVTARFKDSIFSPFKKLYLGTKGALNTVRFAGMFAKSLFTKNKVKGPDGKVEDRAMRSANLISRKQKIEEERIDKQEMNIAKTFYNTADEKLIRKKVDATNESIKNSFDKVREMADSLGLSAIDVVKYTKEQFRKLREAASLYGDHSASESTPPPSVKPPPVYDRPSTGPSRPSESSTPRPTPSPSSGTKPPPVYDRGAVPPPPHSTDSVRVTSSIDEVEEKKATEKFREDVIKYLKMIAERKETAKEDVKEKAKSEGLLSGLFKGLSAIKAFLWKHMGKLKDAIIKGWTKVKDLFSGTIDKIKSISSKIWGSIKSGFNKLSVKFKSFFSDIGGNLKALWNNALDKMKAWGSKIQAAAVNAWNSMKSMAVRAWASMKSIAANAWVSIKNWSISAFNNIKSWSANALSAIKNWSANAWANIQTASAKLLALGKNVLIQARGLAMKAWLMVQRVYSKLPAPIRKVGDYIGGKLGTMTKSLGSKIVQLGSKAGTLLGGVGGKLTTLLGGFGAKLGGMASGMMASAGGLAAAAGPLAIGAAAIVGGVISLKSAINDGVKMMKKSEEIFGKKEGKTGSAKAASFIGGFYGGSAGLLDSKASIWERIKSYFLGNLKHALISLLLMLIPGPGWFLGITNMVLRGIASIIGPQAFAKLMKPITDKVASIWKDIKNAFKPFTDKVKAIWKDIKTAFGKLKQFIVAVFGFLFKIVKVIIDVVWAILKPIFKVIGWVAGFLLNVCWAAIKYPVMAIYYALYGLWKVFSWIVSAIWSVIKAVFNVIWTVLKPIVAVFKFIFGTIWGILKAIFTPIINFFVGAWNLIKSVFGFLFGGTKNRERGKGGFLSKIFGILKYLNPFYWIKKAAMAIWNGITWVINKVLSIFGGGKSENKSSGGGFFSKIFNILKYINPLYWIYCLGKLIWNGIKWVINKVLSIFGMSIDNDEAKQETPKDTNSGGFFSKILTFLKYINPVYWLFQLGKMALNGIKWVINKVLGIFGLSLDNDEAKDEEVKGEDDSGGILDTLAGFLKYLNPFYWIKKAVSGIVDGVKSLIDMITSVFTGGDDNEESIWTPIKECLKYLNPLYWIKMGIKKIAEKIASAGRKLMEWFGFSDEDETSKAEVSTNDEAKQTIQSDKVYIHAAKVYFSGNIQTLGGTSIISASTNFSDGGNGGGSRSSGSGGGFFGMIKERLISTYTKFREEQSNDSGGGIFSFAKNIAKAAYSGFMGPSNDTEVYDENKGVSIAARQYLPAEIPVIDSSTGKQVMTYNYDNRSFNTSSESGNNVYNNTVVRSSVASVNNLPKVSNPQNNLVSGDEDINPLLEIVRLLKNLNVNIGDLIVASGKTKIAATVPVFMKQEKDDKSKS